MYMYQINVARSNGHGWDGKMTYAHFFRTDWIDCEKRAKEVQDDLKRAFPMHNITVMSKTRVMEQVEL